MPEIFIDGRPIQAELNQTVIEAAVASGIEMPYFCWHPKLSIAGNCRVCAIQVEGRSWVEIACNMPVSEGLRIQTDTELVNQYRKSVLQLLTLNHPVDCGICDKAGECKLQDYHYQYNGAPSLSIDPKLRLTKFHPLSERIILDNERCILCSRCVRFTHEISKSKALGIKQRGDSSLVRATENGSFDKDVYSDNVIDLCPVGALLSRSFFYQSRVWYLKPTPSVCPRCARGCTVQLWHRKSEWKLNAVNPLRNVVIERVTPLENPAVNGPWMCNVGRDLGPFFERPRAEQAMLKGKPVDLPIAIEQARLLIEQARRPAAVVSNWGSNEELEAFERTFGTRFEVFYKIDRVRQPAEPPEDDFLVRADKNPNTAAAHAKFAPYEGNTALDAVDLLLVWGEGFDFTRVPIQAQTIVLGAWQDPGDVQADVFIPVSIQTERSGHYTNFEGVVSGFEPCFVKKATVAHAEALFAALTAVPVNA